VKNFPHQFALPQRFIDALTATAAFVEAGGVLSNQWEYGEALVRAGVKNLRGLGTVDERLIADAQKPADDQGTRAAARDIRRSLVLLGFLSTNYEITAAGQEILGAPTNAKPALLREALLQLRLGKAPNVGRPYQLLLRLLNDHPGMPWANSLLALEAQDDSDAEYARVSALAERSPQEVIEALDLTLPSARNARKILPSLARHLGDVRIEGARAFPTVNDPTSFGPDEETVDEAGLKTIEAGGTLGPELTADAVAPDPAFEDQDEVLADLTVAVALRKKRTLEHQQLVRHFAGFLAAAGLALRANPYDLLASDAGVWLLVEAKTLNGSVTDARRQGERALGQLRAYGFFDLPAVPDGVNLRFLALFSEEPTGQLAEFLHENGIEVVWPSGANWLRYAPNQPIQFVP
jgi:hypothetical protein